ncbi:hypothetical protein WJX72_008985 [[Myrmecia] bisecta]|uniref:DUF3700 domain-containing protein n=1 Tax=[Myrmecia] bisecta TaxID=41462 RepID=A0AAW1PKW1_9CHLO
MLAVFHRHLIGAPFLPEDPQLGNSRANQDSAVEVAIKLSQAAHMETPHEIVFDRGGFALAGSDVQLAETDLNDSRVHVMFKGQISNMHEIYELYSVSEEFRGPKPDFARFILSLYIEGFADVYGDWTDQPATLLGALEGDFACILYDSGMGYLLAVRSASAKEPLYWGLDDAAGDNLVISSAAGYLSAFPPGCAYESQVVPDGHPCKCRMVNFTRHTPATRAVETLSKVDSHGHLCGLMFKSKSGRDLMSAGGQVDEAY